MKPQKQVINRHELPMSFGAPFWIIVYLLLDKFDAGSIVWIIAGAVLFLWIVLFGFIKGREKSFSIVSLKVNIEKWLND